MRVPAEIFQHTKEQTPGQSCSCASPFRSFTEQLTLGHLSPDFTSSIPYHDKHLARTPKSSQNRYTRDLALKSTGRKRRHRQKKTSWKPPPTLDQSTDFHGQNISAVVTPTNEDKLNPLKEQVSRRGTHSFQIDDCNKGQGILALSQNESQRLQTKHPDWIYSTAPSNKQGKGDTQTSVFVTPAQNKSKMLQLRERTLQQCRSTPVVSYKNEETDGLSQPLGILKAPQIISSAWNIVEEDEKNSSMFSNNSWRALNICADSQDKNIPMPTVVSP